MDLKKLVDDKDFIKLMPLMGEFCELEHGLWWETVDAVVQSIKQPQVFITLFGQSFEEVTTYITGHRIGLSGDRFFITQAFNRNPKAAKDWNGQVEEYLKGLGIARIDAITTHAEAFARYGYGIEKLYITKKL